MCQEKKTGVANILVDIKRTKWTWAGHVRCRTDNRWTVRATEWLPRDGKRSWGRQGIN